MTMLHFSDSHLFVSPVHICRSRKEPLSLFNNDARALLIYWIHVGGVWSICQAQVSLGTSLEVSAAGTRNNVSLGRGLHVFHVKTNTANTNAESSSVLLWQRDWARGRVARRPRVRASEPTSTCGFRWTFSPADARGQGRVNRTRTDLSFGARRHVQAQAAL